MDRRAKAHVDALDPNRSRRDEAIHTLEDMLHEQTATPRDRFALAKMYLAIGSWSKAELRFRA